MEAHDREILIRLDENVKGVLKRLDQRDELCKEHCEQIATITSRLDKRDRDVWWISGIFVVLWAATISFFDGFWDKFLK